MLEVTRIYKNSDGDSLRIDHLVMICTTNSLIEDKSKFTYARKLKTENVLEASNRVIASISVVTSADTWDDSSGDYTWVKWSDRNIICQMTDLPGVGDEI